MSCWDKRVWMLFNTRSWCLYLSVWLCSTTTWDFPSIDAERNNAGSCNVFVTGANSYFLCQWYSKAFIYYATSNLLVSTGEFGVYQENKDQKILRKEYVLICLKKLNLIFAVAMDSQRKSTHTAFEIARISPFFATSVVNQP